MSQPKKDPLVRSLEKSVKRLEDELIECQRQLREAQRLFEVRNEQYESLSKALNEERRSREDLGRNLRNVQAEKEVLIKTVGVLVPRYS